MQVDAHTHRGMDRWLLFRVSGLLLGLLGLTGGGCRSPEAGAEGGRLVFHDRFDRAELGPDWVVGVVEGPPSKGGGPRSEADRQGHWELREGWLRSPGERNQPLWFKQKLPRLVRVEFDARSESESGDIKFELFGDGRRHESGYIFIFGGWNNSLSVLARRDEHEEGRQKREDLVESGRTYHMAATRTGGTVKWFVDGRLYMQYRDSQPLVGDQHAHFAFNNWQSQLLFRDFRVFDLAAGAQPVEPIDH